MRQQLRFCRSSDGTRLAYALTGEGPPLVKTANWLTHLEHDWRTPLWQPFLARLARGRRLLRYDQRCSGLSDWDADDLSVDANVADLEAVVDAVEFERFDLLGISQGGSVAVAFAAKHPQRVRRLVLYGAFARGQLLREDTRQHEELETLLRLIRVGWGSRTPAYRQVFASLFMPTASQEAQNAFTEAQRASASADNAQRIVAAAARIDVRELAPHIASPTLIVHQHGDTAVSFEEGRLLATLIPGSELLTVEGLSHVLIAEDPAFERITTEIERFLADRDDREDTARPAKLPDDLTSREHEVLDLIARGLDNAEIAQALHVSGKTVRNHVTNILSKLDVAHRSAAIVFARDAGLGKDGRK